MKEGNFKADSEEQEEEDGFKGEMSERPTKRSWKWKQK